MKRYGIRLAAALVSTWAFGAHAENATMCAAGDTPVFSCPLATGGKTVSICARPASADAASRFYYAYGKAPFATEMTYPATGAKGSLTHTFLSFAGNTGGYAFGFENGGYGYAVYSVSGTQGMHKAGVIVTRDGESKPVKSTRCQASSITEAGDVDLVRAYSKLPDDPAIQGRLPTD